MNGVPAEVTLSAGGELRWHLVGGGEQNLAIESEVLGFSTEGREITIRAYVIELKGGEGEFGKRVRKDFVLVMPTEVVAERWSEQLRDFINSLGRWDCAYNDFCLVLF